ncbi:MULTISPECIES: autoinducer binding domain-containing protein [Rhodanobacter]|jgi:LuxR family quorum-sensing system transcriptional regulator SolR|uniref:LuxR family transcriptional regulator, quorum-sensing system regulator SolR n=1 Tax=Rhodanobacter glycinis TaxID=582702 RepID=A0A1I3XNX6_9GAMM|nr:MULTISPECIES: autoinducer binding domain-containing protein [Rhodanobacter]EIL95975.1 transcriptional activator protein solr [Rhodanobacter sp. 115]TAM29907.1 MAG: LuxR family transcriptional regulator [Rhodanobacter sp.]SFK21252.1 LuxR family transcriptional regulator, quorum-sensing system regulator SolR [Rhodanobacter glycinis]
MDLHWQDVYQQLGAARNEHELFFSVAGIARELGFDYCCYGVRVPYPVHKPRTAIFDTYPAGWMDHYRDSGYLDVDPVVQAGLLSNELVVWPQTMRGEAHRLWADACEYGIRTGVACSSWGQHGVFGLLSLARPHGALASSEIDEVSRSVHWLGNLTHMLMSQFLVPDMTAAGEVTLTQREHEVLIWTAEGKTAYEIGRILGIAERTVNFHISNVMMKLGVVNKLQAVVKAIMTGLLQPLR